MNTVAFYTLGCKVNQCETESIQNLFLEAGYEIVDFDECADIYVINTCTVTNMGDRKSRQIIRQAHRRNPQALIVVTGCYAQIAPDSVIQIPGVDLVIGTQNRQRIVALVEEVKEKSTVLRAVDDIMKAHEFEEIPVNKLQGRTRAFLKIQEGCQQFCTYCIIPYTRGPLRSRKIESILEQAKRIEEAGFSEIVLTGIHLGLYGVDLPDKPTLDNVIAILEEFEGIRRIRLSSIEPTDITPQLINIVKNSEKVCPHFHIPLQSGSDTVLAAMRRPYKTETYYKIVSEIRNKIPEVAISTDVIVGFPGEAEEHFAETCKFIEQVSFSRMHVFKYSPRAGTPAAKMPNQIPFEVKDVRSKILHQIADRMSLDFHQSLLGKVEEVLFEQESDKGFIEGLTKNYVRVTVPCSEHMAGEFAQVLLREANPEGIIGELVGKD